MQSLSLPKNQIILALLILALLLVVCTLWPIQAIHRLQEASLDIFYWGYGDSVEANDVVVVGLDKRTFQEAKLDFPRFFPLYEKIIRRLTRAKARAIGFDIGISTAPSKEAAAAFVKAVEDGPPFVVASSLPAKDSDEPERHISKSEAAIISSPHIHRGYVDLVRPGQDGRTVRRLYLSTKRRDKHYLSFAAKLCSLLKIEIPQELFRIPFKGERGGLAYVSCADLLYGPKDLDKLFTNRIVLLGPQEAWFQDYHQTPVGRTLGVQIHANIIQSLVGKISLQNVGRLLSILAVIVPLLLGLLIYNKVKPPYSYLLVLLFLFFILFICAKLAVGGLWLPPLLPLCALLAGYLTPLIIYTVHEALEGLVVKRLFGQFVSAEVFQAIMRDKDGLHLEGTSVEATILFADIRGFTTMSEELGPEGTFAILNEYFGEMVEVIFQNGGRLDKFIGDAIMAVYGAPYAQADDVFRAVKSAYEMQQRLRSLNKRLSQEGKPELSIGIGLSTGLIHAGVIGTAEKMEYAVIGDTVNTASRLEHLTKEVKVPILLSQATYEAVKEQVEVADLGEKEIRGRQEKLHVYGLMALK